MFTFSVRNQRKFYKSKFEEMAFLRALGSRKRDALLVRKIFCLLETILSLYLLEEALYPAVLSSSSVLPTLIF